MRLRLQPLSFFVSLTHTGQSWWRSAASWLRPTPTLTLAECLDRYGRRELDVLVPVREFVSARMFPRGFIRGHLTAPHAQGFVPIGCLLRRYTKIEHLDKYSCEHCGGETNSTKTLRFQALPEVGNVALSHLYRDTLHAHADLVLLFLR